MIDQPPLPDPDQPVNLDALRVDVSDPGDLFDPADPDAEALDPPSEQEAGYAQHTDYGQDDDTDEPDLEPDEGQDGDDSDAAGPGEA